MKNNNLKKWIRQAHHKGFTLLEALVAISILMVAVAAPITIAQKGLSSASYSKDQMIASYLAQDALEYIKNKRDENAINDADWLDGLESCVDSPCSIDTLIGAVVKPVRPLEKSDGNNFYGHSGTSTGFTREIKITVNDILGKPDEALVTVTVKWPGDNDNKVTVNTLIYNY